MLKIPKVYVSYHIYLFHSKYAIRDFREVTMLNAKKLKKRFYIFLVFYVLFGITLLLILDRVDSQDFTKKYKTLLSVFKFVYSILPIVLAWVLTNYIAKRTKNVEK